MRRILILWVIAMQVKNSSAQYQLTDCVYDVFNHMDSLASAGKNADEEWKLCVLDKQIPDFTVITLSGDTIEIKKLIGQVIVMNFWSINCRPCIAEMPGMNQLVRDYVGREVRFIAITWETRDRVIKDFLSKYKFDFEMVTDALPVIDQIAASGYPTTYIINKSGIIKAAWNGGSTSEKAGEEYYQRTALLINSLIRPD